MPARLEKVFGLLTRKKVIDETIKRSGVWDENTKRQLTSLLGTDGIIKSAEKKREETLRHNLFKVIRGLENFQKYASNEEFRPLIVQFERECKPCLRFIFGTGMMIDYLNKIDEIFSEEAAVLEKNRFGTAPEYIGLLEEEKNASGKWEEIVAELEESMESYGSLVKKLGLMVRGIKQSLSVDAFGAIKDVVMGSGMMGIGLAILGTGVMFMIFGVKSVPELQSAGYTIVKGLGGQTIVGTMVAVIGALGAGIGAYQFKQSSVVIALERVMAGKYFSPGS